MNEQAQPGNVHCCSPETCSWAPDQAAPPEAGPGTASVQAPNGSVARELEARELSVLLELGREAEAEVAFQGLRRELDLHQQQLSRTLDRLEDDGLVASAEHGYQLTETGFRAIADHGRVHPRCGEVPLAQVLLPPGLDPEAVTDALAGRWFKGLRWYGKRDGPGETTLIWQTEPEADRVRLKVTGATVTLSVDPWVEPGAELFSAVHTLLAAATRPFGQAQAAS